MQRLTQNDFLLRSRKAHGKKYDYSQAKIISATEKVTIVCPQHGPFKQAPYAHYPKAAEKVPFRGIHERSNTDEVAVLSGT
jgi:hypothetical protein